MELEELLALLVRFVGAHVARSVLSRLVEDARRGELRSSARCRQPSDAFDCDELGIYDDDEDLDA